MALTGKTNEEKVWNYLYAKIKNKYGVAGLMGNLEAESGFNPIDLEDTYEKKLGYTDQSYTDGVNSGKYDNFIHDKAGYGLAQWTFWSRKKALYEYARLTKKVSIGDLEMQLEFLVTELQEEYPKVWKVLTTAKTVREASNSALLDYERPADQSTTAQNKRASYGQTFYDRYAGEKEEAAVKATEELLETLSKNTWAKYLTATTAHWISNSGSDEKSGISGGQAGDQTGNEWKFRSWYDRPWSCVLRYPDSNVALKIAELSCEAASNDKIGYDQSQRMTYWTQLQKAGYRPSKITTACEADCSAGVIANTRAAGYLLNISKLKDLKASYTGDMRTGYKNAGFEVLTDSKYTTSTAYLLPGDILLNDNHHTATNLTIGSAVRKQTVIVNPGQTAEEIKINVLQIGSKGELVKTMQKMLIACGYSCGSAGADGDFGNQTAKALRQFQKDQGLVIDGVYGPKSKAALEKAYESKKGSSFKPYLVKVTAKSLNIRDKASTNGAIVGKITDKGVYTIVEKTGSWGKLKSGAGWISLNYTKRI